jgi:hypothetical protein
VEDIMVRMERVEGDIVALEGSLENLISATNKLILSMHILKDRIGIIATDK